MVKEGERGVGNGKNRIINGINHWGGGVYDGNAEYISLLQDGTFVLY